MEERGLPGSVAPVIGRVQPSGRTRRNRGHRLLSMKAVSCDLETAPTFVASTEPFLNSIRVGMPRMPYLGGVLGFSSMLSLATLRRPAYSLAISSRMGAIILQG